MANYIVKEEISKRLDELDEFVSLSDRHNPEPLKAIIVGGAALILRGYIDRSTKDIDFLYVSKEIEKFLKGLDMNTRVQAYLLNFPEDYEARLQPLNIGGRKIRFYTASLEDIVIAKLYSYRDHDIMDINNEEVVKDIDWVLLDRLAADKIEFSLNQNEKSTFSSIYDSYRAKHSAIS